MQVELAKSRIRERQGATIQAYGAIGRKEERKSATQISGFAQGQESLGIARDHEHVERPVAWQMIS